MRQRQLHAKTPSASQRILRLSILTAVVAMGACSRGKLAPQPPAAHYEFVVGASRDVTFDALLRVAHHLNLNVRVIEKASGLMAFENATLNSTQLDEYCKYPFVKGNSTQPFDTFANWNRRSIAGDLGPVIGSVNFNIVLTPGSPSSTSVDVRSTWTAFNLRERYVVGSKGVLEHQVEETVLRQLRPTTDKDAVDQLFN